MANPLSGIPTLHHRTTLHNPSANTRTWSSQPHLSPSTPLLATASSDKSIHIWDMRDWKLLSTIAGGHKRSIRCVGWKDYGRMRNKRRKAAARTQGDDSDDGEGGDEGDKQDPVVLATGSFDANCGLWVWNGAGQRQGSEQARNVPGSFGGVDDEDDGEQERDFTHDQADESEEWHFSTLLTGPDSEIKDLQFSPPHYGANLLATCSRDKSVWVWEEVEPEEWETVAVLSEHTGDVKCVSWLAGARTSKAELRRRLNRRRQLIGDVGTSMEVDKTSQNGGNVNDEEQEDEIVLGGRELLASGSYDDTIRLHHDDEAEGDWMSIAVLTGHDGTVWDLSFESYVNLAPYPKETTEEEVIADWAPRLISCSDDMSVRIWGKELTEKEEDEKRARIAEARQGRSGGANGTTEVGVERQTGFMSNRLPSVIRPPTSTERWLEEARLPSVHVRSVYAVDWSAKTGLVVSCGGDGLIAVYREVVEKDDGPGKDVIMDGAAGAEVQSDGSNAQKQEEEALMKKLKTKWTVVAQMEAAHDEYEINHVCWAPRRDFKRQDVDLGTGISSHDEGLEEYIISTGDDGQVRAWQLPKEVLEQIE